MAGGFLRGVACASGRAPTPAELFARWPLGAALLVLTLAGCPSQELAPLSPCTVSLASIDAKQSGTDQVDLLFLVDNSGSMAEEQVKLNEQLPRLVQALTSGDFDGVPNADGQTDFKPVGSLRLGLISSDMGSSGVVGVPSCGATSLSPTTMDINAPGAASVDRPFGDDGLILNSTTVAVTGAWVPNYAGGMSTLAIPPRPECALNLPRVLEYPAGGTPQQIASQFSCVAELGANGCTVEQQLESVWKALAPSTDRSFSRGTGGQGLPMGFNAGFLRPEAILALILVTDEDDCSAPDANAQTLYSSLDLLTVNAECVRRPEMLHPVQRYINGLRSLKAEQFRDRIIFAGIVGVPLESARRGQTLDQILARPDMQNAVQGGVFGGTVRPVCMARGAGTAAPARRIVQVAQGFGENGVVTSICEDNFAGALDAIIEKIAGKLSGECLPRSLTRSPEGVVECRVVEIKAAGDPTPCDMARGRFRELSNRLFEGTLRRVCEIQQLPVRNRMEPQGVGWYYDDFSSDVARCMSNRQRIAFTASAAIEVGAAARFECFRAAVNEPTDPAVRGLDAVNMPCPDTGRGAGEARCRSLSTRDATLTCVNGSCQLVCQTNSDCQLPKICSASDTMEMTGYCVDPTCPI